MEAMKIPTIHASEESGKASGKDRSDHEREATEEIGE